MKSVFHGFHSYRVFKSIQYGVPGVVSNDGLRYASSRAHSGNNGVKVTGPEVFDSGAVP